MTKASKASVHYTDHAENHKERCALCTYFITHKTGGSECTIVLGKIAAAGWCEEFQHAPKKH